MPIAKITTGSNFSGALNYDLEKKKLQDKSEAAKAMPATADEYTIKGFAEGERARVLGHNLSGNSAREWKREFEDVAKQRKEIAKPVKKISISFKPEEADKLNAFDKLAIAQDYLEKNGYKNSPFMVTEHRDTDHPHMHILTSRVDYDGKLVKEWQERIRARKWAQSIEKEYGLTPTPTQAKEKSLTRGEIARAERTGEIPARLRLQEAIKTALEETETTTEFVAFLTANDISTKFNLQKTGRISGVSFETNAVAFKGSSLGKNFSWNRLLKQGLSYEHERDFGAVEEANQRTAQTERGGETTGGSEKAIQNNREGYKRVAEFAGSGAGAGHNRGAAQSGKLSSDSGERSSDSQEELDGGTAGAQYDDAEFSKRETSARMDETEIAGAIKEALDYAKSVIERSEERLGIGNQTAKAQLCEADSQLGNGADDIRNGSDILHERDNLDLGERLDDNIRDFRNGVTAADPQHAIYAEETTNLLNIHWGGALSEETKDDLRASLETCLPADLHDYYNEVSSQDWKTAVVISRDLIEDCWHNDEKRFEIPNLSDDGYHNIQLAQFCRDTITEAIEQTENREMSGAIQQDLFELFKAGGQIEPSPEQFESISIGAAEKGIEPPVFASSLEANAYAVQSRASEEIVEQIKPMEKDLQAKQETKQNEITQQQPSRGMRM
jgi:hypothetical protein